MTTAPVYNSHRFDDKADYEAPRDGPHNNGRIQTGGAEFATDFSYLGKLIIFHSEQDDTLSLHSQRYNNSSIPV